MRGHEWTDSGAHRDQRGLKHRAPGEHRVVPCPPELTVMLHEHITVHDTGPDGRLFCGERGGPLPKITIRRAWLRARREVFTPDVLATKLAGTPYDLRHAAVSTWLNGGVSPATVAEWAGHSVEVLLTTYAKCLGGSQTPHTAGPWDTPRPPSNSARIRHRYPTRAADNRTRPDRAESPGPRNSLVTGLSSLVNLGAPGRIRTCDLPLRRRALYPLSYEGRQDRVAGLGRDGGGGLT
jgi:hypothetical protein